LAESSFTQVRTPLGVSGRGFALWAHNATKLWTVLVPAYGIAQLIGVWMVVSTAPSNSVVVGGKIIVPYGSSTSGLVRVDVLRIVLLSLVGVFGTGVALRIFAEAAAGGSEKASDAARFALSRYGSLLWVSILCFVCMLAGTVVLILPGIYALVVLSVALPVLVIEGAGGGKALRRSSELSKGRWWATLGALLPSIALLVAGSLIVETSLDVSGSVANLSLTQAVAQLVVEVLLAPILTATTIAIYADLRARKEPGAVLDLSEPPASAAGPPAPAAQGDIWWS
jgi:hypothetical protein